MDIDLSVYLKAATAGVPLLFLVFGIVEILKLLKRSDGTRLLSGNAILLASLGWGLLLGVGYWIAQTEPPQHASAWTSYAYWFAGIAFGLGLGILAAVFFEALKALVLRAVEKIFGKIPPAPPGNPMAGG